jgi:hypothetical protein
LTSHIRLDHRGWKAAPTGKKIINSELQRFSPDQTGRFSRLWEGL